MRQRKKLTKPKAQKESQDKIIKNKKKFFILEKENKAIREKIIGDIKKLLEQEEDYYKPISVGNFWSNNYTEYEGNSDTNKNLSANE